MPTAAKLVAGIVFALVAWFATRLVIPYLPEGVRTGYLGEIATGVGFVMGWTISGRRAGKGVWAGLGYGLTTVVATVLWVLAIVSVEEMIDRSLKLRYDGVMLAAADAIQIMINYAHVLMRPDILVWLLCAALFGGWVTERAARTWR